MLAEEIEETLMLEDELGRAVSDGSSGIPSKSANLTGRFRSASKSSNNSANDNPFESSKYLRVLPQNTKIEHYSSNGEFDVSTVMNSKLNYLLRPICCCCHPDSGAVDNLKTQLIDRAARRSHVATNNGISAQQK
jgi:hypothetical protein